MATVAGGFGGSAFFSVFGGSAFFSATFGVSVFAFGGAGAGVTAAGFDSGFNRFSISFSTSGVVATVIGS